jgi:CRP-like cAMP-binding protein
MLTVARDRLAVLSSGPRFGEVLTMAVSDLATRLGRAVLFNGLDPDDLGRLAAIAREITLSTGDTLFDQGDESDGLYVIVSWIVRIYLTAADSREATINLLEDGEIIGEMALLDGLPRSAGAAALTDTKLIFIPREPFLEILDNSRKLARQIILSLCERLRAANAQFDQAIFHDLRHRLLVLLRQLAIIHGQVDKDVAVVDLDLTQGTLAQMLGASREAVNKQLRALAKEGRIEMDGPNIRVFRTARK